MQGGEIRFWSDGFIPVDFPQGTSLITTRSGDFLIGCIAEKMRSPTELGIESFTDPDEGGDLECQAIVLE